LEGNTSNEHVISQENNSGLQDPEQISRTNHPIQEGAPILTIEVCNGIVKGGRNKSPILINDADQEFFKIKEQRFTQIMQKFDNGNETYTISHPIAMSLVLALETEQRNKNVMYALNENENQK
jgi:hypothetical protein